ncbi:hypothetical protein BJV74DRAFT_401621 [Russula compacta]|nr:hypothetical protein BJV74DRAFT_401621 [Russula compacta]
MSGHNPYNQTWNPPATNDPLYVDPNHNAANSSLRTLPQPGAPATLSSSSYPSRVVDTTASVPHGLSPQYQPYTGSTPNDHSRGRQSSLTVAPSLGVPREHSRSGLENHLSPLENLPWDNRGGGGHLPQSQGQPAGYNMHGRHPSQPYEQPPQVPSSTPDVSPHTAPNCRIPGCRYKAYYNYAEQEQTEYCGQGHEFEAIATGLVNTCVVCKGRPRRTGERVCGRTCRDRERQAHPVQGSYYGVQVVRRESRTRPGP